jgi:hypothetical protein
MLAADAWELHTPEVQRDPAAIEAILQQLDLFWENHILKREPPEDELAAELELPKVDGTIHVTTAEPYKGLADLLLEAQANKKEWTELEEAVKVELKKHMEHDGHGVIEVDGLLRAYYLPQEGRTILDQTKCKGLIHAQGLDITEFQKKTKASRPFRSYDLRGPNG